MAVPHPSRGLIRRAARERALKVWLITIMVGSPSWLAVLYLTEPRSEMLIVAAGAVALILSVLLAVMLYCVDYVRRIEQRYARVEAGAGRLERQVQDVVGGLLPTLVDQLHEGVSPQAALDELRSKVDGPLMGVLDMAAGGITAALNEAAQAKARLAALEGEAAQLAETTLPALATRIRHERVPAATAVAELPAPLPGGLESVVHQIAEELGAGARVSAAAMAACAAAGGRIQAQTTRMLARLRELEDRYGEDEVFGDLLELDHHAAQMGRLADTIVLLCGGRSGRRWTRPIVMQSILRGAMSRISGYQRVHWHSTSTAAIAGFAAEGVMHALAELMDNAIKFSPSDTKVHVYVEDEGAGIVMTIEDAGLGMRQRERQRAEQLVSRTSDLTTLPSPRLGLAVVGRLARKHGLTVNFRPSSRGGVGVVVLIPRRLLTHAPELPAEKIPVAQPVGGPPPAVADATGMPKRRRGATLTTATMTAPTGSGPRRGDPERLAAFHRSASGRTRPDAGDGGTGDTAEWSGDAATGPPGSGAAPGSPVPPDGGQAG